MDGVVQGVGFRWFVREYARRRGLAGWVRNRPDGTVEVAASGSAESIAGLREALTEGPAGAVVDRVQELPTDGLGELPSPFTILK